MPSLFTALLFNISTPFVSLYRLTCNNDYVINQLTDFLSHQRWVLWSPCGAFPAQPPGLFLSPIFPRVQPHFSHGFQDSCQRATRLLLLLLMSPYFIWLPRGWGCPPTPFGHSTVLLFCFVFASFSKLSKTPVRLLAPYLWSFSGRRHDSFWFSVLLLLKDNVS